MPEPAADGVRAGSAGPRRPLARALLVAFCGLCVLLFASLGIWQVQRLFWKLDLIERVEARFNGAPSAPPHPAAFAVSDPLLAEYRRVRLSGRFLHERETLVQAVTELGGGFWVLTPFEDDAGFTVLVNRGFVPPERRAPSSRAEGLGSDDTEIVGLIRLSEPDGGFLRENRPEAERWFSRDVAAIAAARGLENAAPYFVDAQTPVPGGFPVAGLTVVRFTNNHLVYALTWFGLAGMSLAAGLFLLRGRRAFRRR